MAMEEERRHEMAARIRQLRGPKPQPVVAAAVGVGLRTFQTWEEAAAAPSWENLQALAHEFRVSENYLLYGDDEPAGPETQLDRIEMLVREVLDLLRGGGQEPGTAGGPVSGGGPPAPGGELGRRAQGSETTAPDRKRPATRRGRGSR